MPRMKLVIPEMDSAPKAGQRREITSNCCIFTMTTTGHFFLLWYGV